ncbi:MAG: hypothetical protein EXR52_07770 [Dehalococcoidia bacterium]|nr:hypothetical protein [Dehalococcoidia bacterium]
MCSWIVEKAQLSGSGKGANGWFELTEANVVYDHPYHAQLDHALCIDFVNPGQGLGARVAVELTVEGALELIKAIEMALDRGRHLHPDVATPRVEMLALK